MHNYNLLPVFPMFSSLKFDLILALASRMYETQRERDIGMYFLFSFCLFADNVQGSHLFKNHVGVNYLYRLL